MSDILVGSKTGETGSANGFNPEAFSANLARALESSGRALSAYLQPRANGDASQPGELHEVIKTLTSVTNYWLADQQRAAEVQTKIGKSYLELLNSAARRLSGEATTPAVEPSPRDKRFQDPEWKTNQFFDFF